MRRSVIAAVALLVILAVAAWFGLGMPGTSAGHEAGAPREPSAGNQPDSKATTEPASAKPDEATAPPAGSVTVTINVTVTNSLKLPQLTWECSKATLSRVGHDGVAEFAAGDGSSVSGRFSLAEHPWLDQSGSGAWSGTVEVALRWFGEGSSMRIPLDGIEPMRVPGSLAFAVRLDTSDLLKNGIHIRGRLMQGDSPVENCALIVGPPEGLHPSFWFTTDATGEFSSVVRPGIESLDDVAREATATPWQIDLKNAVDEAPGLGWSEFSTFGRPFDAYFSVHATPVVAGPLIDFGDVQLTGGMLRVSWPERTKSEAALDIILRSGTAVRALRFQASSNFPVSIPLPRGRYEYLAATARHDTKLVPWMTGTIVIDEGGLHELIYRDLEPDFVRIRVVSPAGELKRATLRMSGMTLGYPEVWEFPNVDLPYQLCTTGRERVWVNAKAGGVRYTSDPFVPPLEELILSVVVEDVGPPPPHMPPDEAGPGLMVRAKVPDAIQNDLEGYVRFVHESGVEVHDEFNVDDGYLEGEADLPQAGSWTVSVHGGMNWGYGPTLTGPVTVNMEPGEYARGVELPPLAPPPWDSPHYVEVDLRCEGRPFQLGAPCRMADGRITPDIETWDEDYPVAVLDGETEVPFKIVKEVDEDGDRVAKLLIDFPARVRVRVNNAPAGGFSISAEGTKAWCWGSHDEAGNEAVFWLPAGPASVFCTAGVYEQTQEIVVPRDGALEIVFDIATGGVRFVCESEAYGEWELFRVSGAQWTHIGLWDHPHGDAYVPLPPGTYRAVPDFDQQGEVVSFEVGDGQETVVHLPAPRSHETREVEITLPDAPPQDLRQGELLFMRNDFGPLPDSPMLVSLHSGPLEWRRTETGIRVLGVPKGVSVVLFGYLGRVEHPETIHWYLKPLPIAPQASTAQATWVKSVPLAEEWGKLDVLTQWKFEATNVWQGAYREQGLPAGTLRLRYAPNRRLTEIKTCTIEVADAAEVPLPPELRALIQ